MSSNEIVNLLLSCVAVLWLLKIIFHYRFIRDANEKYSEANFISFFINLENLFAVFTIVFPLFFGGKTRSEHGKGLKIKVWIIAGLLWVSIIVSFIYLYQHPPTDEVKEIHYDFTDRK